MTAISLADLAKTAPKPGNSRRSRLYYAFEALRNHAPKEYNALCELMPDERFPSTLVNRALEGSLIPLELDYLAVSDRSFREFRNKFLRSGKGLDEYLSE